MDASPANVIEIDRNANKSSQELLSEKNKNVNREFIESFAQDGNTEFKDIKESVRGLENEKDHHLRQSDDSPLRNRKGATLTP